MRRVPWWAWMALAVSAGFLVPQLYRQHVVTTVEEKVFEREFEPILRPEVLVLTTETPTATPTVAVVYKDAFGVPIDLEFCARVHELNPQTVEKVLQSQENLTEDRITMVPYYRCRDDDHDLTFANWAFVVKRGPKVLVHVPEGGHITRVEGIEQDLFLSGDVLGTYMQVRGRLPLLPLK